MSLVAKELGVIGLQEIAALLEVEPRTATQWNWRGLLPPPDGSVSGSPAWRRSTILRWAEKTGRMPKTSEVQA